VRAPRVDRECDLGGEEERRAERREELVAAGVEHFDESPEPCNLPRSRKTIRRDRFAKRDEAWGVEAL